MARAAGMCVLVTSVRVGRDGVAATGAGLERAGFESRAGGLARLTIRCGAGHGSLDNSRHRRYESRLMREAMVSRIVDPLTFDLHISRQAGDQYRAVARALGGEFESDVFTLPLTIRDWVGASSGHHRVRDFTARSPAETLQPAAIGASLFKTVFSGRVLSGYDQCVISAMRDDVRLRICLHLNRSAPEIMYWPWECLRNEEVNRSLALSEYCSIVRVPAIAEAIRPRLKVRSPLKVLVMIANPKGVAALNSNEEWDQLHEATSDLVDRGLMAYTRLDSATLPTLAKALDSDNFHILHYIGHGAFDARTGQADLVLDRGDGSHRLISGDELYPLLDRSRSLRLLVLNSCKGAVGAPHDAFSGIAQKAMQAGLPAVVAMQDVISDRAAITFARGLYGGIASGLTIDGAVTKGRTAIVHEHDDSVEWAVPVLYMRDQDGRLFDMSGLDEGVSATASKSDPRPEPPIGVIERLFRSGQIVPFLGPLASAAPTSTAPVATESQDEVPSRRDLAYRLADSASFPDKDPHSRGDLAQVAAYYADFNGRRGLRAELRDVFRRTYAVQHIHRLLAASAQPLLVVTTNYDTLIEQAFREAGHDYDLVVYPTDRKDLANAVLWWTPGAAEPEAVAPNELLVPLNERSTIFKMHGSVDLSTEKFDSFVVTEDDNVEFLARVNSNTAVPAQFLDHCRDRSLLFLGCSIDDWHLRIMLKAWSRHVEQRRRDANADTISSWAVQPKTGLSEIGLWQRCQVQPFDLSVDAFADALARRTNASAP